MIATLKRFRALLCAGAILCATPIATLGVAAASPPVPADNARASLSGGSLSALHFVALPDAALARTTGAGLTPPAVAIRIPDRGRVALWDELNVRPSDLGAAGGQVSITINSR